METYQQATPIDIINKRRHTTPIDLDQQATP